MKKRTSDLADPHRLRTRAQRRLAGTPSADVTTESTDKLRQQLDIHRIELEMQNEQLRQAQTQLEAGLDRYTQLFDFAPIGYATLARDGTVLQVNHVGASLLGRQRGQVVRRLFLMFVARSHQAAFTGLLMKLLAEKEKQACEVELARDGAERTVVHLTATTLAGVEPTILLAFEDVSASKRAEAALRRAHDELLEADRRKDEFLAVLSHELRTPLSSLLLHGQLLQRGKLDEAGVRRSGELIEKGARVQSRLIEDLLDVSRIVTGKLSLKRDEVNLEPIVRAAVEAVAAEAKQRTIDLAVAVDASVPNVVGDPTRLQQAVWNLLANAIKFTPPEGRIDVTLDQIGDRARIQVRDTGAGIEPKALPYLFVRFFQADRTTTRSTSGLGLGLSIAHSVIEAHRGQLRAESAGRGMGSTFTITLPTTAMRSKGTSRVTPRMAADPNIQGARLLVIEDDASTRATLTQVLELAGATVRDAPSGAAAMSELDRFQPDLLVCDIAMPVEDGCTLLRRIRARGKEHGGDVRALALTAFAGDEARARTREAGFQEHLVKPVNIGQLLAVVSSLLPPRNANAGTAMDP